MYKYEKSFQMLFIVESFANVKRISFYVKPSSVQLICDVAFSELY